MLCYVHLLTAFFSFFFFCLSLVLEKKCSVGWSELFHWKQHPRNDTGKREERVNRNSKVVSHKAEPTLHRAKGNFRIIIYIIYTVYVCIFVTILYIVISSSICIKILIIAALNQKILTWQFLLWTHLGLKKHWGLIPSPTVCGMLEKSGRNMSQAAVMKMTD